MQNYREEKSKGEGETDPGLNSGWRSGQRKKPGIYEAMNIRQAFSDRPHQFAKRGKTGK